MSRGTSRLIAAGAVGASLLALAANGCATGGSTTSSPARAADARPANRTQHKHPRRHRRHQHHRARHHARRGPARQARTVRAASHCSESHGLPDPNCTPGAVDPAVTQANIASTICRTGYTTIVRPPTSYTEPIKERQLAAYGDYAGHRASSYEEDHLISLELGGSPRAPRNLWPEAHYPKPGSYQKDGVENYLHRQVCSGAMTLRNAQRAEATNWVAIYRRTHG
jgi:hypothetical protein